MHCPIRSSTAASPTATLRQTPVPFHHGTDPDLTADSVESGVSLDIRPPAAHPTHSHYHLVPAVGSGAYSSASAVGTGFSPEGQNADSGAGGGSGGGSGGILKKAVVAAATAAASASSPYSAMGDTLPGSHGHAHPGHGTDGGPHQDPFGGRNGAAAAMGEFDDIMEKAKKAAHHIFILNHSKSCSAGELCSVPSCAGAKRLLEHIRSCGQESVVCPPQCAQAKRLIRHWETCHQNRSSVLARQCGGSLARPICLVCSLVTRAIAHTETMNPCRSSSSFQLKRKALNGALNLGHSQHHQRLLQTAPAPVASSIGASASSTGEAGAARNSWVAAPAARDRDGFLVPAPVTRQRSVSWGGYDRLPVPDRRPRFASILEEPQAEDAAQDGAVPESGSGAEKKDASS